MKKVGGRGVEPLWCGLKVHCTAAMPTTHIKNPSRWSRTTAADVRTVCARSAARGKKWRGRDSNPHQLTATFRKRASLLPVGRWELPPSRTFNSFQCLRNPLPVRCFRERRKATLLPYLSIPSRPFESRYYKFLRCHST